MLKEKKSTGSCENKIWLALNTVIEYIEKDRFTPLTAFIFLVIIGVIRSVTESTFFEFPVFSSYLVIQHVAFNFPVLVMGVLIIKLATGVPLRKVYNVIIPGFVFVLLPPFIDFFLLGLGGAEQSSLYAYYGAEVTFIEKLPDLNIVNMLYTERISPGLKRMALMILFSSGLYIAVKIRIHDIAKLYKKRSWRPIVNKICALYFGVYGIWVVIWFIGAIVPTIFSFEGHNVILLDYISTPIYTRYYLFMMNYGYTMAEILPADSHGLAVGLAQQQRSLFITMFFLIFTTSMMIFSLHLTHNDLLKKIVKSLKTRIIFITTGSALLGTSMIHLLDPNFSMGWAIDPGFILHFPYIFYIASMGFFLGCYTSFLSEYGKKNAELPQRISKHLCIVSILAGGSMAFLMGPVRTLIVFSLVAFLLYIAFKDGDAILSLPTSVLFAVSCVLIFLLGFYTPEVWKMRVMDRGEFITLNLSRTPTLDGTVILLMFALFVSVFLLSYYPTLLKTMSWIGTFPGSLILIPIFLMPAIVGSGLIAVSIIIFIGVFIAIPMNDDIPYLPLKFFGICLLVYCIDLWGYFPTM